VTPRNANAGLDVRELSVAYGGNVAVDATSFSAPLGAITGLIGPNGAGKTSAFNACNGLVKPAAGTVTLFGRDMTTRSPAERARAGLGRTFQTIELCDALDVRTNVALGVEARWAGANPLRQLASGRARRRETRAATDAALELCGIADLATRPTAPLNIGQRRLVELARVLAGGYPMLLLDEPSSGLDEVETSRFGQILVALVAARGLGVLLVEHDVGLVMSICSHIYVLDFGQMIFDGTPAETRSSRAVRAAYLGDDIGAR
jgi:ABC-type branched-subunit amino acid transport system ATPase component